jgi:SEL1 protein
MSFAALGGDIFAQQVLAFWHFHGVAIKKSCEDSAFYYLRVAEHAIKTHRSGPPLGLKVPKAKVNLADEEKGGLYGPGVSGAGDPVKKSKKQTNRALTTKDILEFYMLQADSGDSSAQLFVGQIYYQGTDGIEIDYAKSRKYLLMATGHSPIKSSKRSDISGSTAQACAYLGQMYWRGDGVTANNETARKWFEKGAILHNGACLYALGVMNEEGTAGFEKVCLIALIAFRMSTRVIIIIKKQRSEIMQTL